MDPLCSTIANCALACTKNAAGAACVTKCVEDNCTDDVSAQLFLELNECLACSAPCDTPCAAYCTALFPLSPATVACECGFLQNGDSCMYPDEKHCCGVSCVSDSDAAHCGTKCTPCGRGLNESGSCEPVPDPVNPFLYEYKCGCDFGWLNCTSAGCTTPEDEANCGACNYTCSWNQTCNFGFCDPGGEHSSIAGSTRFARRAPAASRSGRCAK
jgi:hypothetical protein